ncbi:MAG: hypothetical protein P0S93_04415 [Candidatus Neptunochlamydia sp.]|nr:hypothetical protein [Candidatus Neptunochlamydia sp.]
MLDFFRRYQRYFFVVIAVVIVISFSFFGTHQTINQPQQVKDRCIGHAVDGSKMMRNEVDQMIRFIGSDRSDITLAEKGIMPNFFNDGVVRKDLMGAGIGALLVNAYFEDLKEELQEKMEHHKNYHPYVHPTAPFISVKNLWGQALPAQKVNLERFLEEANEMTPEIFSLLVDLYLGEAAFPAHILREYLMFQEKQYDWIQPDPALPRANLNLFQCRSTQDWFGPRFLDLSAQFILNAAAYAKQQGYKVTYGEARVDLIRKGYESLQIQMRKVDVAQEEVANLWQQQLRNLGMREKDAVSLWKKVMLFRRLFEDVGGAVFVDPHVYQMFYGFASKTAEIDLYHLPKALELKDFSALMKLEYYLDQVMENRKHGLLLPQNFASISEIEKNCPELIEERFLVEIAEVQKSEVALNVSIKEMWEWQLEKDNYELLEKQFPQLALKKGTNLEEHFAVLEEMDPEIRQKIDKFSIGKIVEVHPEWIEEALSQKHPVTKQVSVSPGGKNFPYEGEDLLELFRVAALKGDLEQDKAAIEARRSLEVYTADDETYYRFHILDRDLAKAVLTFEEANERGILDALLENHLKGVYSQVRSKNPGVFKTEKNEWKPVEEVKSEIGRILYSDTLEAIDTEVSKLGAMLLEERHENVDSFYPKYRLFPYMVIAEQEVRKVGDESHFLEKGDQEVSEGKLPQKRELHSQWNLVKRETVFKNHEKSFWFTSDVFAMVAGSWSEVLLNEEEQLQFFQLKEKLVPNSNFSKEMKQGQLILSKEAKQYLMSDFLKKLKEKQALHISHDSPERT